jgi:3-hydroxyacyl-CoA dehydrogenase
MKIDQAAIIGAGAIGVGWAIVFARSGIAVNTYDLDERQLGSFHSRVEERLKLLAENHLLDRDIHKILGQIHTYKSLQDACVNVSYLQECGPERLEVKKSLFGELESIVDAQTIIASSSSALKPSAMAADLKYSERFLVVHPANPPYLLPIAEVVPSPSTNSETIENTFEFLSDLGMKPVLINGEPEGFVFNRLQGAVLREAYCLVRDGVISAKDLDLIVTQALARRWSLIGPFTTSALNVEGGNRAHAARMADSYYRMGLERGQDDPWSDELVEKVSQSIEQDWKVEDWEKNVLRRDLALMHLLKLIQQDPELKL